jgi:protein-tyrosine phosphatase
MLELAIECGTAEIVATPHASPEYEFNPELNRARLDELRDAVSGRIRLHSGCDFHLSHTNVEDALAHPAKYTINQNGYLLVELSDLAIFRTTASDFARLTDAGIKVIITHPERNPLLRQRIEELTAWVTSGCYLQVTAGSVIGRFGSKAEAFARSLLDADLVHFIASDAHGTRDRNPDLRPAFELVRKRCGDERAELLFVSNPRAVLDGLPIAVKAAVQDFPRQKSWLHRLLRRQ